MYTHDELPSNAKRLAHAVQRGVSAKTRLSAAAIGGAALLLACLLLGMISANFQHTTAVWPVPVATDASGAYQAGGWAVSSPFGWRDAPLGGSEFHDGIDITNPDGQCPFGYHCGARAMFDGAITYVGWDQNAGDPSRNGGGQMVILSNGADDHKTIYAHLEPYRLYVQLQGKITDPYGRYDAYADYRAIGPGELKPDLSNGGIEMWCANDMPNFIPTRIGPGAVVFLYDRPASCRTVVVWGERGHDWKGWIPDDPGAHGAPRQAELIWRTPIESGQRAGDVALRFRAHLVPPPPPPSPTVTAEPTPARQAGTTRILQQALGRASAGQGAIAAPPIAGSGPSATPGAGRPRCERQLAGWVRCAWSFADIPTEQQRLADAPPAWLGVAPLDDATPPRAETGDDEGPTVPAALLRPTTSATPIPTSTRAPEAPRADGWPIVADGIGGRAAVQITAAPAPHSARISPSERVWLAPGASHTWTLTLANNQHGAWFVLVAASDPRLFVSADAPCGAIGGNGIHCALAAATTTLHITISAGADSGGLSADIPLAASDVDSGGSGPVVGDLQIALAVGAAPAATPTPVILPTPVPMGGGGDGSTLDCAPQPLVRLPNVIAPQPKLVAPAAASFQDIRTEIAERAGIDALVVLADVLRNPSFSTSKQGVLRTSWHKAGRAIDLNAGGPFVRIPEGRMFRLFVNNVDITAIFEAHGWRRIPVQGDTLEWWHYEYHPDGIAWTSAMVQVWPLDLLQSAFPEIAWAAVGCTGGSNIPGSGGVINPPELDETCTLGVPHYRSAVETFDGCGPPVRVGDHVQQLDSTLGFVGLTGQTTGPHLHLGMQMRNYDGSWASTDICTPNWLQGRAAPADASCFTDMVDPLDLLPLAPPPPPPGSAGRGANTHATATPIIPEGAPYQLPPPNYPGSLVFTPAPAAAPTGQYWSPFADGGQYGGGDIGAWLCATWNGWPWCQP